MEFIFNLVWLALAVAGLGEWLLYSRLPGIAKHSPLRHLGVVAIALALLFPVISATDDLHALPADCEDTPVVRTIRAGNDSGASPSCGASTMPAILTRTGLPSYIGSIAGIVDPLSSPSVRVSVIHTWTERGPPPAV
jgi:hypothetical protein